MSAKKAVNAILTGAAAVTAIASTRVWPVKATQDKPRSGADLLPYVVYYAQDIEPGERAMDGTRQNTVYLIAVQCWAREHADCEALAEAVRDALDNYGPATAGGVAVKDVALTSWPDFIIDGEGFAGELLFRVTL